MCGQQSTDLARISPAAGPVSATSPRFRRTGGSGCGDGVHQRAILCGAEQSGKLLRDTNCNEVIEEWIFFSVGLPPTTVQCLFLRWDYGIEREEGVPSK